MRRRYCITGRIAGYASQISNSWGSPARPVDGFRDRRRRIREGKKEDEGRKGNAWDGNEKEQEKGGGKER